MYGLGYRLKPPPEPTNTHPAPSETSSKADTQSALHRAWEKHKPKQFERLATLETICKILKDQPLSEAQRATAEREAHKLSGSLGSFGFPTGSKIAQQIETIVMATSTLTPEQAEQLQEGITSLRHIIEAKPSLEISTHSSTSPHSVKSLLILTPNLNWARQLHQAATAQEFQIEQTQKLSTFTTVFNRQQPDAVLIDLQAIPAIEDVKALMIHIHQTSASTSVIILAESADLNKRVALSQAGRHLFLTQPIQSDQVLQQIKHSVQTHPTQGFKLLIVDDDPAILSIFQTLLPPWGIQPLLLEHPRSFWQHLTQTQPDLIILDADLPDISGIDLCQVVRSDPDWSWIPILFMTAYSDPDLVHQLFAAGADDYIRKPIIEPELLSRIFNRIERIQLLRRAALVKP